MEYNSKIYEIPLDEIEVDYSFNTRQADQMQLGDLIGTMRAMGQTDAGKVMHQPNAEKPYKLISGFRRYSTLANHTDIKTFKAIVIPECDLAEQLTHNFTENHARKDLTMYDNAMVLKRFYDMGEKEIDLIKRFGLSRQKGQTWTMLLKLLEGHPELEALAKSDQMTIALVREIFSVKNHSDRARIIEDLQTKAKFKIRLSVDKSTVETKRPRATMLCERTKPLRKRFMEWALGVKVPFSQWPTMFAWINGECNDNDLMDVLQEMKNDPCCYADFKHLISEAESYVDYPENFLTKVLAFQASVKDLELERPVNGIPTA